MVLMEKDGTKEFVPDAFIDHYRSLGYKVEGEKGEELVEEQTSEAEVQTPKASSPKKRKS